MKPRNPFWPKHAFCFGGGGGGTSPQQIANAPVPTPAPPVTTTDRDVVQAKQDLMRQEMLKRTVRKTIMAGDTGGFQPGQQYSGNGAPPATPPVAQIK